MVGHEQAELLLLFCAAAKVDLLGGLLPDGCLGHFP